MSEAYANALILARAGHRVFPSSRIFGPGCEDIATIDVETIHAMHKMDRAAVWMVKCGAASGLLALDTPRARDLEYLIADYGHFEPTMMVRRRSGDGQSNGVVRWFACDASDDIKLGAFLAFTKARFRHSAVVPGSVHRNGEPYEILDGGPFDLRRLSRLPDAWIQALPKNTESITANIVRRAEFSPNRSSNYDW